MSAPRSKVDMAGGANVLRCLADFIACRPGLPDLVNIQVTWWFEARGWEVSGQLHSHAGPVDVGRWGTALDDPVITAREYEDGHNGPYTLHKVTGTMHGHAVKVWAHVDTRDDV